MLCPPATGKCWDKFRISRRGVAIVMQFVARIPGILAELVVHVGDVARRVGNGHDGMGVECGLDVAELLQRGLHPLLGLVARAPTRFHRLQSLDQFRLGQAGVVKDAQSIAD